MSPCREWCAWRPGGPIRAATDTAYVERREEAASGAAAVGEAHQLRDRGHAQLLEQPAAVQLDGLLPGAGALESRNCLDGSVHYNQLASFNFLTRLNSSRLFVTRVNPVARAWLAISMSCGPIGVPLRSRSARILP